MRSSFVSEFNNGGNIMKHITLIGSRDVPEDIAELQQRIGYKLASIGYHGRSGAAAGSDTNFLRGYCQYAIEHNTPINFTSYIPWAKFKNGCIAELIADDLWREDFMESFVVFYDNGAEEIASKVHPAWDNCSQGARKLHTRNVPQLLGHTLDNPSSRVICYAKGDTRREIKGGTALACRLAEMYGVSVSNLFVGEFKEKCCSWVEG